MNKNIVGGLSVVILFLLCMGIYRFQDVRKTDELLTKINSEYQALSRTQKIQKKVMSIPHPYPEVFRNSAHHAFVEFSDFSKIRVTVSDELFSHKISLDDVLAVGDWVRKDSNNDTLYIIKIKSSDTLKYRFQIWDLESPSTK